MSIKKIRDKYGPKKKSHTVINLAIRAEMPGGDTLLDTLELTQKMRTSGRFDRNSEDALGTIEERLHQIRDAMAEHLLDKYSDK